MKMERFADSFESITSLQGFLSAIVMCHDIYGHHKIGVCIPRLMPDTDWNKQASYYHDEINLVMRVTKTNSSIPSLPLETPCLSIEQ